MMNSGRVDEVIPFPGMPGTMAIFGEWSGGTWSPGANFELICSRDGFDIGRWKMVGVDMARGRPSPALLARPIGPAPGISPGDRITIVDMRGAR
jgi:hypothetical protein